MIVTRGDDQVPITTSFQTRNEPGVVRNYGRLVVDFAKITPDGLVVFFPILSLYGVNYQCMAGDGDS